MKVTGEVLPEEMRMKGDETVAGTAAQLPAWVVAATSPADR